jgi:hypothetical protein
MGIFHQLRGLQLPAMSLFEPQVTFLNRSRDQDERVLENRSARSVFVWLLIMLFLFGVNAGLTMYQFIRLHRFNWSEALVLTLLGILVFRSARAIYRQLGR